jgi:tetratricopeptide (TPR) repeat protein
MDKKLLNILLGSGLFLIITTFNPFFSSGLYFDSTASFTFIAAHKILLLGVLNAILLGFWFIKVIKTKQLKLTASKVYIPAFIFLGSAILSTFLSVNKLNSTFGFSSTLGTSVIESFLLLSFFFFFVNNIRSSESVISILRFVLLGVSLSFLWVLIRYASNSGFDSVYLREYVNSRLFSPLGGHSALMPIALLSMCLSSGLFMLNMIYKKHIPTLVIDGLNLTLATISFFNFASIEYKNKNYFFIVLGLLFFAFIGFLFAQYKNLKNALIPVLALIFVGTLGGLLFSKFIITKNMPGFGFPRVAADTSLSITLDSMQDSIVRRGLFGVGQGNFTYAFDFYKSESAVAGRPLTSNNAAPMVGEVRANYSGSYILEVLFGQGLLGMVSLLAVACFILYRSFKKLTTSFNFLHLFVSISFGIIFLSLFVQGYEAVLVLLFWLLAAISVVLIYEDEPQKDFDIAMNGSNQFSNLNYIIPLLLLVGTGFGLFNMYKITNANVSMFWGKVFQSLGNTDEYRKSAYNAVMKYPDSDVFVRELVNGNGAKLIQEYQSLQRDIQNKQGDKEKLEEKDLEEFVPRQTALNNSRVAIINDLSEISRKYPNEYKNYYMLGALQTAISELAEYSLDNEARDAFDQALARNKYHPATNYQLALIYERNKRPNEAFVNIDAAYRLNSNDIYLVKYADIAAQIQDYDRALNIYKGFRTIKEQRSDDQNILKFYNAFNIDKKIEAVEKAIAEREAAVKEQQSKENTDAPKTSPTPTVVPTTTSKPNSTPTK